MENFRQNEIHGLFKVPNSALLEDANKRIAELEKQVKKLHKEVRETTGENVCLKLRLGITTNLNKGIRNYKKK